MKKLTTLFVALFAICLWAGASHAVNNLNEPGSLLVYPLIDNINGRTIIDIVNRANTDVWLQGYMITHPPGAPSDFEKKDFFIHLTQKEPFFWNTSQPYNREDRDGVLTQIQGFAGRKGFMFVWAVDSDKTQIEIDWDWLKGDGLVIQGGGRAFRYNAIPHQALAITGDRILGLDGVEYTASVSQINCEGFAETATIGGKLVVASLDIDFINSIQPELDINLQVWNQNEVNQSRYLDFEQFEQYDLTDDLQLNLGSIFTQKWQFATTTTGPIWAVFYQTVGSRMWGGQCHQQPETGVAAIVILPPVPLAAQ